MSTSEDRRSLLILILCIANVVNWAIFTAAWCVVLWARAHQ